MDTGASARLHRRTSRYRIVKHAAARTGMSPEGAYYLRRQRNAEGFAAAWLAALDHGIRQLEDIAVERAIHGAERPVYTYGKLVGHRRDYNDWLIMFMLRNRASARFVPSAARSPDLTGDQVNALRAEWCAHNGARRSAGV